MRKALSGTGLWACLRRQAAGRTTPLRFDAKISEPRVAPHCGIGALCLLDDSHAAGTQLFQDEVVGNGFADDRRKDDFLTANTCLTAGHPIVARR